MAQKKTAKKKTIAKAASKEQIASFDYIKKQIVELKHRQLYNQEETDRLYKEACELNDRIKGLEALLPKVFEK